MSVRDKKRIEFLESEISKAMDAINLLVAKNDKQRESYFATEKLYFDQKDITELAVKGLKEISDGGSTGEDARDMRRTADYTLFEIERLGKVIDK